MTIHLAATCLAIAILMDRPWIWPISPRPRFRAEKQGTIGTYQLSYRHMASPPLFPRCDGQARDRALKGHSTISLVDIRAIPAFVKCLSLDCLRITANFWIHRIDIYSTSGS
jgi:hypothetical protein